MALYRRFGLPWVIHFACSAKPTLMQRMKVVPSARGRVLEVGIDSGLNLPFYDPEQVDCVCGLDPSREMLKTARKAAGRVPFDVELVPAGIEDAALGTDRFDTVVTTYTLCTIPDPVEALRSMARVLRPGGQVLFCEHGLAPDIDVRRWQDRMNPLWHRLGGGCNLNRDIPALFSAARLEVDSLDTMYIPGWRPASFNYWGHAHPADRDESRQPS